LVQFRNYCESEGIEIGEEVPFEALLKDDVLKEKGDSQEIISAIESSTEFCLTNQNQYIKMILNDDIDESDEEFDTLENDMQNSFEYQDDDCNELNGNIPSRKSDE
jgi:hypothetical protein